MSQEATVSILIPCYNAERWIAQAIESALTQTYPHKEIIIVDDGSTDDSLRIIKTFEDCIRWESQSNQGGNATRNRLLSLSSGEWIQYLDADDYLKQDKIAKQIQFLMQHPDAEVIYSPHITEDICEQEFQYNTTPITDFPNYQDLWLLTIQWHMPQTGGLLFRKSALLDIGGWQENLKHCQDYDLYARLLMANKKFAYFNHAGAVYRWWCSGTVTRRGKEEIYRDRLGVQDMIETHLEKTQQLTPIRQDSINQARFEYARRIYSWDKSWAIEVATAIKQKYPQFQPSQQIAPNFYRQLYKLVGFSFAESVAEMKRTILR
jgi:glycosyltransferase involved in cell wall biosynthesis